jgi:predicted anti-sigma-YlaC factor YlaD
MWMLIRGFGAWRESGQLEITTAQLAVVAGFVLAALLLTRCADLVKRFYAHHPVLTSAIAAASGVALEFGFSSRFPNEGI